MNETVPVPVFNLPPTSFNQRLAVSMSAIWKTTTWLGAVSVPRALISLVGGDIKCAVFLSQSIYWTRRLDEKQAGLHVPHRRQFFWKTATEWQEEIGLSAREQERVRKTLVERGFLRQHRNDYPSRMHYRADLESICIALTERTGRQVVPEALTGAKNDPSGDAVLGPRLVFLPALLTLCGDFGSAVYLSQLLGSEYWQVCRRGKEDGWVESSAQAIQTMTGLTEKQQVRIRTRLHAKQLLLERRVSADASHEYQVNLRELILQLPPTAKQMGLHVDVAQFADLGVPTMRELLGKLVRRAGAHYRAGPSYLCKASGKGNIDRLLKIVDAHDDALTYGISFTSNAANKFRVRELVENAKRATSAPTTIAAPALGSLTSMSNWRWPSNLQGGLPTTVYASGIWHVSHIRCEQSPISAVTPRASATPSNMRTVSQNGTVRSFAELIDFDDSETIVCKTDAADSQLKPSIYKDLSEARADVPCADSAADMLTVSQKHAVRSFANCDESISPSETAVSTAPVSTKGEVHIRDYIVSPSLVTTTTVCDTETREPVNTALPAYAEKTRNAAVVVHTTYCENHVETDPFLIAMGWQPPVMELDLPNCLAGSTEQRGLYRLANDTNLHPDRFQEVLDEVAHCASVKTVHSPLGLFRKLADLAGKGLFTPVGAARIAKARQDRAARQAMMSRYQDPARLVRPATSDTDVEKWKQERAKGRAMLGALQSQLSGRPNMPKAATLRQEGRSSNV